MNCLKLSIDLQHRGFSPFDSPFECIGPKIQQAEPWRLPIRQSSFRNYMASWCPSVFFLSRLFSIKSRNGNNISLSFGKKPSSWGKIGGTVQLASAFLASPKSSEFFELAHYLWVVIGLPMNSIPDRPKSHFGTVRFSSDFQILIKHLILVKREASGDQTINICEALLFHKTNIE